MLMTRHKCHTGKVDAQMCSVELDNIWGQIAVLMG